MQNVSVPHTPTPIVIFRLGERVVISETAPCRACGMECMVNRLDYEEVVPYVPRDETAFRAFAASMDMRIVEDWQIDLRGISDDEGRMICSACQSPLPH